MVQIKRWRLAHGQTKEKIKKGADHATVSILGHSHSRRCQATPRVRVHRCQLDRRQAHDERGHAAAHTSVRAKEFVSEKWSARYKRSINCARPRGFSQRAHCAGRKKNEDVSEDQRISRRPGQPTKSKSHSDLYTDENPRGTIHGLRFASVQDARDSVHKIRASGRSHAHKIQAAVAMEQRAKTAGKTAAAAVYRRYINKMKKKTKQRQLAELQFRGSECTQDCSGHRAGYEWWQRNRRTPQSRSASFDRGAAIAAAGG